MKYIAWFSGILVTLLGGIYLVAFTPFGNSFVKPIIEEKIAEQIKLKSKLTKFSLTTSDFEILLELNKNNTVLVKGNYSLFSQAFNIAYRLKLEELSTLKQIIGMDIRGTLLLNGKIKGNKEKLIIDGKSDFAASDISFVTTFKDFTPDSITANIKNLRLEKVLYMFHQPHYSDGIVSLNVDISDARVGQLKGKVHSSLIKGLLDSKYMTKTYAFKTKMPKTMFDMKTETTFNANIVDTKLDFNSNLANFDVQRTRFDISDSSITSDYFVKIANLDKLYFATNRHLKGEISANGEFKKAEEIDITIHSKLAGGVVDAKLHNDDFHADLNSLETLDILKMLIYPEVFNASLNGILDYNLVKQKGVMKGDLVNGKFTKNRVLDLTKKYVRSDLYQETFNGKIVADINKENILASLSLKSNKSSIMTKNTKLNSKTEKINSKLDINANGNKMEVTLNGDVASPKVSVDVSEIIKEQVTQEIKKLFNNEDTQKAVSKFFKGLF